MFKKFSGSLEIANIYFGIHAPLSFKVEPLNGNPEHIITVTRFTDVFEAGHDIARCWRGRGIPVIVTHILN